MFGVANMQSGGRRNKPTNVSLSRLILLLNYEFSHPSLFAKGRAYRRAIKAFPLTLSGMENYCGARHIPDEILPCACGWHQADLYFFLSTLSHGWEQSLPAGSGFIVSEPGRALVSLEWGVLLRLNGFHAQCWPVIWGKLHKLVIPAQPVYTVSFFLLL